MISKNVEILLSFIAKINDSDSDALYEMMTDNHVFIDMAGDKVLGRDRMLNAWDGYMRAFPNYHIYIKDIYELDSKIIFRGTTTGSHLGLPDDEEFMQEKTVWIVEIRNEKISSWQIYKESDETIAELGLSDEENIDFPDAYEDYKDKLAELT